MRPSSWCSGIPLHPQFSLCWPWFRTHFKFYKYKCVSFVVLLICRQVDLTFLHVLSRQAMEQNMQKVFRQHSSNSERFLKSPSSSKMTSSTDAAAVETHCSHFLGVFPLVCCHQNVCWQIGRLFFWQDATRLTCCYAYRLNTTCTRVRTPSPVLPPRMTASLPLSLSFLPPPPPPVIRLFTGTTPTHSLKPGINTEPWPEQRNFRRCAASTVLPWMSVWKEGM